MAANNNRKCQMVLREAEESSQGQSIAQRLREVNTFLNPNGKASKKLYEKMPEAVKRFAAWKREAATLIIDSTDMASFLLRIFKAADNSKEDLFDYFISMDQIGRLNNEIAHCRVIDNMALSQDAARDFAQRGQWHSSFLQAGTATEAVVGAAAFLLGMASAPVAGTVAAGAILCQSWFGWNRIRLNRRGRRELTETALELSDIAESIERDVRMLDEIGVHVGRIEACQRAARQKGQINNIQKDRLIVSAGKIVQACEQYTANSSE